MLQKQWTLQGAEQQPILGNTHMPSVEPRGVLIIAHGFKGYKEYGMFPRIAAEAAQAGFIAHRFNFSYSGMTNNIDTFEQPELFERDTWNRQVEDLTHLTGGVQRGELDGAGLPLFLFGHSRGGVSVLLFAGRTADDDSVPKPAGIITAAAPDRCNTLSEDEQRTLLEQGYLESPSNRTGQVLRIGKAFLQEQLDEPEQHDLLAQVARIRCPILLIHGENDPTVPADAARSIASAARDARVEIVPEGDHVFNTPNPMPRDAEPSPQLRHLLDATLEFASDLCSSESASS